MAPGSPPGGAEIPVAAALGAAVVLALVHLFAGRLRLPEVPRSQWLSAAGGTSVAYVFVHLLPEIAEAQRHVEEAGFAALAWLEHHAWLLALVGLAVFYGLERAAKKTRNPGEPAPPAVFWVHMASFGLYNGIVGYLLLHRLDGGWTGLVLFAVAMAFHFLVNDHGLSAHHSHRYRRIGRWLLSAAVVAGAVLGLAWEVSEAALGLTLAFLGGGVILNVMKEELPEERESRFGAFALGAAAYAALLLVLTGM